MLANSLPLGMLRRGALTHAAIKYGCLRIWSATLHTAIDVEIGTMTVLIQILYIIYNDDNIIRNNKNKKYTTNNNID